MRLGDGSDASGGSATNNPTPTLCVSGCCSFLVVSAFVLLFGISSVEVTEYGLNYSRLTRKVTKEAFLPGRYWIGPFNHFIRFPSTVTTIAFADAKLDPGQIGNDKELRSRTKDGLDVHIELSFQYALVREKLYDLFVELGGFPDYHNTFVRIAMDRLTEDATLFTATEFFRERTLIGKNMEEGLKKDFEDKLHSTIFSFQLRTVNLPDEFEEAIQNTEVKKQDLRVATAEQNSTRVQLETQLMQAQKQTQVRANQADGFAQSVMLDNQADIAQFTAQQERSADSYAAVLGQLDHNQGELLDYMKIRALRDHPSGKTMIGLSLAHSAGT